MDSRVLDKNVTIMFQCAAAAAAAAAAGVK